MPFAVMHPYTIKLPTPCLMVFLVKCGSRACSGLIQQYWWPSDLKSMNLDSSENATLSQSSTVHNACCIAHSLLFSILAGKMKGFDLQTRHNNPCSLRRLQIMQVDMSGNAFFWTSAAFAASTHDSIWAAIRHLRISILRGQPILGFMW